MAGVPLPAPDSVPEATRRRLLRKSKLEAFTAADTVVRTAVWVRFRPNTAQSDRVGAVAAVNGTVIGGAKLSSLSEGFYLLHIPARRSGDTRAMDADDR